jgi:pyruvate,water dikinase
MKKIVVEFDQLSMNDVALVGGKNASLGEMIRELSGKGIKVPGGFATTSYAFWQFIDDNQLRNKIFDRLDQLDSTNSKALKKAGKMIRQLILKGKFSSDFKEAIKNAYEKIGQKSISLAVRSSATAEDLPNASFAGQQETYLNITSLDGLYNAIKKVFASLYTDRAISYRIHNQFDHRKVALSVGIQMMVRSDLASSGVMFTIDMESGFDQVVLINSAYGLGETVVQGSVNPDEFCLYKPNIKQNRPAILRKTLGGKSIKTIYAKKSKVKTVSVKTNERHQFSITDEEAETLARYAIIIHEHYQRPMDIEWAKDGVTGELFIVQARPETVESHESHLTVDQYHLKEKGKILVEGRSIGHKIGQGKAKVLLSIQEMGKVNDGDVLVTDMTDPDWEPIMKKASAIVTNRGGRTCHAAIVARELGVPAIIGCGNATDKIPDNHDVTVSCAEGEIGFVYDGKVEFTVDHTKVDKMPKLKTKIMMNIANPDLAFKLQFLPNDGVGLARVEFIINDMIGIHPNAILNFETLKKPLKKQIEKRISGYKSPVDFYVDKLTEGVSTIAAAFYPKPVIVRMSDFKTNEYANLLGGKDYEPSEENPMIGFRGASRYVDDRFKKCFELECRAIKKIRDSMGLTNVWVMIPFCRTVEEGKAVLTVLEENGLKRGENSLQVICMCEIPSNALQADEFLDIFDGFSIGSNDLTQLTLGLDRDSALVAKLFDERNGAVKILIAQAIKACNDRKKYIGICGQAPSDYPDFATWLMDLNIQSMSLNPDTVIETWLHLSRRPESM